jgi:DNA sulfur modification protein DndE
MAIKTNKENHSVVKRLKDKYDFPNHSIPAKIAINYTLQLNKTFNLEEFPNLDNNGMEYDENTLFSGRENYSFYRALFSQQYGRVLLESEFNKLVKIHLDFGLNLLKEQVLDTDRGRNSHIDYLMSIIKRGLNLIAEESIVSSLGGTSQPSHSITGVKDVQGLVDFDLGNTEGGQTINIRLNDLNIYESHHIAIAGMNGSGKTELIKDILYQIAQKTNQQLKFIYFDYKGEGQSDNLKKFLEATGCNYVNPLEQPFELNPLSFVNLSNEKYQTFNINSFVDAVSDIETRIGPKQKSILKTVIARCFDKKKKEGRHPTLSEVYAELEAYYEESGDSPDSLIAVMQDLKTGIFSDISMGSTSKIYEKSLYLSLPDALSEKLRQLCVFLTLRYLLAEFTNMNDTIPDDNKIKPLRYVIVIDEAHVYLNNKNARGTLQKLLRVIRSKGVVVIMISQGAEDYYKPDFDFASQVKIPICLFVKNKNPKQIERFVGTAKHTNKLHKSIEDLNAGKGLINLGEPQLFELRQFWKTIGK